jgi:hypothetical protein
MHHPVQQLGRVALTSARKLDDADGDGLSRRCFIVDVGALQVASGALDMSLMSSGPNADSFCRYRLIAMERSSAWTGKSTIGLSATDAWP